MEVVFYVGMLPGLTRRVVCGVDTRGANLLWRLRYVRAICAQILMGVVHGVRRLIDIAVSTTV